MLPLFSPPHQPRSLQAPFLAALLRVFRLILWPPLNSSCFLSYGLTPAANAPPLKTRQAAVTASAGRGWEKRHPPREEDEKSKNLQPGTERFFLQGPSTWTQGNLKPRSGYQNWLRKLLGAIWPCVSVIFKTSPLDQNIPLWKTCHRPLSRVMHRRIIVKIRWDNTCKVLSTVPGTIINGSVLVKKKKKERN